MRNILFTPGINPYALASVMAEFGNTKVHITVSKEEQLPPWLKGKGQGWITAEYAMLPHATHTRTQRDRKSVSGRTQEIQRLIGRCLRASVDLKLLGEVSLMVDCDVLVADGGTRTTSISGGQVALELALTRLNLAHAQKSRVAAVSVGISPSREVLVDLNYQQDSSCVVDMNIVMTEQGDLVEVQGAAEGGVFSQNELQLMMDAAQSSLKGVFEKQAEIVSFARK